MKKAPVLRSALGGLAASGVDVVSEVAVSGGGGVTVVLNRHCRPSERMGIRVREGRAALTATLLSMICTRLTR